MEIDAQGLLTPEGRQLIRLLAGLRGGATINEMAEALGKVVDGVFELTTPGSVTLKLNVKPLKGDAGKLIVEDGLASRPPQDRTDVVWIAKASTLQHTDPRRDLSDLMRHGGGVHLTAPTDDDEDERRRRDLD